MDHDAMHRDVQGLKNFRKEAEEAIAFYKGLKLAGGKIPSDAGAGVDESLRTDLDKFMSDTDDRLKRIEQNFTDFDNRLTSAASNSSTAGVSIDQGVLDRMEAMLTWFEGNKEGLEVLLSLDGEPDAATDQVTGSTDGAGTASGGVTGGADAPNPQTGTDTGPGSVDGLPGISQDPSADASIATDQPAAKPE